MKTTEELQRELVAANLELSNAACALEAAKLRVIRAESQWKRTADLLNYFRRRDESVKKRAAHSA